MNVNDVQEQLWSDSVSDADLNQVISEDTILEDILLNSVTARESDIVQCERDRDLTMDRQSG